MTRQYWEQARINGQAQVDYASSQLDEIPLPLLGDHPPIYCESDRHRVYEEEFTALVDLEVRLGRVPQEVGDLAVANFHDYMRASQLRPLKSPPRFY